MSEAVFHNFGYIHFSNDKLNNFDRGLAIDLLVCFNIRLLMPSGPVASLTLRVFRMSLASDSKTRIRDNTVLLLKFGNGMLASSISETDIKNLFRASAFLDLRRRIYYLLYVKVEYLWMYCFFP